MLGDHPVIHLPDSLAVAWMPDAKSCADKSFVAVRRRAGLVRAAVAGPAA